MAKQKKKAVRGTKARARPGPGIGSGERIVPGESWITLATKTFPNMRSMTAEEVAAYRAFKKKIARRVTIGGGA